MNYSVYLRPLTIEDAQTSYKWRNNPKIWRFTGNKPDRYITAEMEAEWLGNALKRKDEARFAICLATNDQYIGNIFLTNITSTAAELHIFIGDVENWGGGHVYDAARLLFDYAFIDLKLDYVYNVIKKSNVATLIAAKRVGFELAEELGEDLLKHIFTKEKYEKGVHNEYIHKSAINLQNHQ